MNVRQVTFAGAFGRFFMVFKSLITKAEGVRKVPKMMNVARNSRAWPARTHVGGQRGGAASIGRGSAIAPATADAATV